MKVIAYLVAGVIVCTMFLVSGLRGYAFTSALSSSKWDPRGQSQYHK